MRHGKRVWKNSRYLLDFRNPEVAHYLDRVVDRVVHDFAVGYFKFDYNVDSLQGTDLNADSPGQGLLEHNRALLAWLEGLLKRYPTLVIENCGSGGGRMDYAMLSRLQVQSATDQENYLKLPAIITGSSAAVLPEQMACWSYPLATSDPEQASFNMVTAMLCRIHQSGRLVLWTITLLGALLGTAFPGLAPGGRPHPALQESWRELASIAAGNARALSAPFLLAFFRFPAHPRTRQFGDLLIAGVLGANALRVGLALGRWHTRLIPYLPQLPLEWLAAALAGAAWLALRKGARRHTAIAYLAAVLVVVTAAAAVETIATPHAHARTLNVELGSTTAALHSAVPIPTRRAGGGLPSLGSCAVAGNRFKVASLPSPRCRSVPLTRLAGAAGLRQPPPDPRKEGPP